MNGGAGVEVAPAATVGPPPPLEWIFEHVFGERSAGGEVQEVIITILKDEFVYQEASAEAKEWHCDKKSEELH